MSDKSIENTSKTQLVDIINFIKEKRPTVPIWHKVAITLDEAVEYSNIGKKTLIKITDEPDCPFVFWVGNKRLLKRARFEEYLNDLYVI